MQQAQQPTLFLPGTLCDERIWMPLWQQLADVANHRAYVPLQWANDLEQMQSLTKERIEQFDQPVHLIGYSMGAYIASLVSMVSQSVAQLTLIGYSPFGLNHQEIQQRKAIIRSIDNQTYQGMTPLRLERFLTGPECHDKALVEQVLSMSNDLGGATLRAQICATTPRKDLTDALRQLEIPIHCITAEHDQIAPAKPISDFCAGTRHIRQSRIDDTAHMMLLTKPREVADALMA